MAWLKWMPGLLFAAPQSNNSSIKLTGEIIIKKDEKIQDRIAINICWKMRNFSEIIQTDQFKIYSPWRLNKRRFISYAFWGMFALIYLYLNRLLVVVTYENFRLGFFVLGLGLLVIIFNQKVVKNRILVIVIILFSGITIMSALVNQTPLIQFLAFIRIPLIAYLIYNLVVLYLNSDKRVIKVLRFIYFIAALQLPLIALQRFAYPWLPSRLIYTTTLTDFGTGTFTSDTAMAFALIGLVVLLLFDKKVRSIIKRRWLLSMWLSVTILFSNSQIQHITIVIVWVLYIFSHLRINSIIIGIFLLVCVAGLILLFSQSSLMTYPLLQNTLIKMSAVSQLFEENVNYDIFLSGGYARGAALSYYINQPVRWIGEGPGSVYDTSTGQRTVGAWGHVFTFYAEVGLVGLLLSFLVLFVLAFPVIIGKSSASIRVSWVGVLMFLTVVIVSFVKYPLGDTAIFFSYCLILKCNQELNSQKITEGNWSPNSQIIIVSNHG